MSTNTLDIPTTKKGKSSFPKSAEPHLRGGYFMEGKTYYKEVFIPEEFTEEQQMIADTVVEFCVKNVQEPFFERGRELEVRNEEDKAEVVALMRKAGELGLSGVSIPEEYGGLGLDFNTGVLFSEAVSAGFSFATTLGAQTSIGSLPIVFYGNEIQKQKYLPGIASCDLIAAYALTEPTAGSDANSGKTKATLTKDGQFYLINGQKIWITNGGFADVFVVFAKIEDDKNLSAFIVERNFEGLTIGAEEKKMGIKGSSTVQLFFDNCKVPAENLLSDRGAGFKMALNILNTGRIKLAAGGMGGAKFALQRGIEYAVERKQFNQSIAKFGAIQYKIGDIAAKIFAVESAVYRTGKNIDSKAQYFKGKGQKDGEYELNAVREFAVECALLKVKGSELACYATDEAMQIFGGMGYSAETGLEMGYRDSRITKIYEGTNDINRMLAVGELTKRSMQTKEINLLKAGKKIPSFIFRQYMPIAPQGKWGKEKYLVQAIKNSFLLISGSAGKKLRKKLIDEQEIILHLSEILAEAYLTESIYLRIRKLHKMEGIDEKQLAHQKNMMQLYFYEALENVRKTAKIAIASFAKGFEKKYLNAFVDRMLSEYDVNPRNLRRDVAAFVIERGKY